MQSQYDILGVDKNATREELTIAYRRAAMRWHPDRNPDDPDATERFQEIERAYRLLLQITPRMRIMHGTSAGAGVAPAPEEWQTAAQAQAAAAEAAEAAAEAAAAQRAAAQAAAVEAWRRARNQDLDIRRRHTRSRRAAERAREQAAHARTIKNPLYALIAVAAAYIAAVTLPQPQNYIALSALLFLAMLLTPRGNSYTAIAIAYIINTGVKLYFIGALLWLLWQAAQKAA